MFYFQNALWYNMTMYKNLFLHKIDAYIVESPSNRFYFTDFNTSFGYAVLTENTKTFYTDSRYFEEAKSALTEFTVKCTASSEVFGLIAEDLKRSGVSALGYEDDFLTVSTFKTFKKAFESFALKPASGILQSLRLIKTQQEIDKIISAQRIAEKVFEKVARGIRPGDTEREVRADLMIETLKAGGDGVSFEPVVAFGENSAIPHHKPDAREFKKGDLVLIDYGVRLNGYCSDMTRSFFLSEPDEDDEKTQKLIALHETVLGAQAYALKHLKAGMTCREADSLAREYIRANGYDKEFSHSLGHGLGIEIHEQPRLNENTQDILLPGMVVTVEPGIYIPGLGGIRIEDMVVIREDGVENLTETPKDFEL